MPNRDHVWQALHLIAAALIALLGGLDKQLTALVVLILIDAAAGLVVAMSQAKGRCWFDWDKGFRGVVKKLLYFLLIMVAVQMDNCLGFSGLRTGFIVYLALLEIGSIFEHCGAAGIPVPNWISDAVDKMRDSFNKGGGGK